MAMNDHIPPAYDDRVFYYAERIVHDTAAGEWDVHVDPENCLVALSDGVNERFGTALPTVDALVDEPIERHTAGDREIYEGRLLLGAGVIPMVGDDLVLIFRDADAPADPLRWTGADGRVDATPTRTAFEEFHEELLVFRAGTPVYVDVPGAPPLRDTYTETLRANGYEVLDPLPTVEGTVPERYRKSFEPVRTHFGEERTTGSFFVDWNPEAGSLEAAKVVAIGETNLTFADGEFDRCVQRFPLEMAAGRPAEMYVRTVAAFLEHVS
ncbi:hypothetical protein KY092_17600 [Natronomonas gomsonensis]|jgi:hypothetical protein|uniref:hypothetical protein n=1 Tax=Natronomonas gomsonensis TaxID=1046043 RepID=UPI0020CA594F|nr:hypothetical protein [Natronomonas gomsonensis]MCY4732369.1 hypothetical protein [Natronomonas gomsonensis]